ncbi:proline-rich protein 15 [Conger conger]|uniref:proline-rich protein 15 n=1 Tax=Conger conger TaxID=82655 RepID=UPI002A59F332|nr:proline-rich protein 15 [Conger conger]
MTRKKTSSGSQDQEVQLPSTDSETQTAADKSVPATGSSTAPAGQHEEPSSSCLFSGEMYDDARFEPLFNEQYCRRNLKVSRSGRFKEKRKMRASLPEDYQGETVTRQDDKR